jgi:lysophospholipase L1-like esterase
LSSWVAAAVVGAVLTVSAGGCALFDDDRPVVGFLGDSITFQATTALEDRAPDTWRADVRATSGATIVDMAAQAARMGAEQPEAVIVNLGTNDVMQGLPPEKSAADLDLLLDQLGDPSCVVLVTVHENIVTEQDGVLADRVRATNAALAEVADRRGVRVVDWTAHLAAAGAVPGTPDLLIDTVHLSDAGIDNLVGLYLDTLADGCGPPAEGR